MTGCIGDVQHIVRAVANRLYRYSRYIDAVQSERARKFVQESDGIWGIDEQDCVLLRDVVIYFYLDGVQRRCGACDLLQD